MCVYVCACCREDKSKFALFPFAFGFGFAVVNADQDVAGLAVQGAADLLKDSKLDSVRVHSALDSCERLVFNSRLLGKPVTRATASLQVAAERQNASANNELFARALGALV
jgi:hypothetical protein